MAWANPTAPMRLFIWNRIVKYCGCKHVLTEDGLVSWSGETSAAVA